MCFEIRDFVGVDAMVGNFVDIKYSIAITIVSSDRRTAVNDPLSSLIIHSPELTLEHLRDELAVSLASELIHREPHERAERPIALFRY